MKIKFPPLFSQTPLALACAAACLSTSLHAQDAGQLEEVIVQQPNAPNPCKRLACRLRCCPSNQLKKWA